MAKDPKPAQLVIIRHAESMRNVAKKGTTYFADEYARSSSGVDGVPDHKIELTPTGWEQARKSGPAIRERFGVFDYVYTSGYVRTEQTKEGVLEAYTPEERALMKFRQNPFLRERDPGYTYNMTTEEAERNFSYLKEYWEMFGSFLAVPPGGESLAWMMERTRLWLNMIFERRMGQKVLAFTHGGTKRCLRATLEHWDYDQATTWPPGQSPKNCGVTVYDFNSREQRLVLSDYNTIYY